MQFRLCPNRNQNQEHVMHIILRPRQVAEILSISISTLWRIQKREDFPKKITLSPRTVGWRQSDIDLWLKEKQELS